MRRFAIALAFLVAAAPAAAQLYKWVDKDGKVRYGDTPPPGAKTSSVRAPAASEAPPAPAAASKDAKKGPLTPAEQAKAFRERQEEQRKAAEKEERDRQARAQQNEGCERTREYLRTLESGQRIARTNPNGERYYLNEDQVRAEIEKARSSVREACK